MRPRQSGGKLLIVQSSRETKADATGGTAHNPLDLTLSDTEPVLSDAPVAISKPIEKPLTTSGSDIVGIVNGKRVRPAKVVRDGGEASTSRLAPEAPATKRSRHSSPATSSPAPNISEQPLKKKNTARKSTQHISSSQSLICVCM
jgi:hypothetical protein